MQESRKARRYQLSGIVVVTWLGTDGTVSGAVGISQDISIAGVCFITAAEIAAGTRITANLRFRSVSRQNNGITLRATGVVLRVEPLGVIGSKIAAALNFQEEREGRLLGLRVVQ